MGKLFKTKEVAVLLGVNQSTVQRWIKNFEIECKLNEHGHYLIDDKQVKILEQIKKQLNSGQTTKQIYESKSFLNTTDDVEKGTMLPAHVFATQLDKLMIYVEQLERKLDFKADEVVEYQFLHHRAEFDNLLEKVSKIEARINLLEENKENEKRAENKLEIVQEQFKERPKRSLMKIFSF